MERFYAEGFGFLFDNTSCVVLVFPLSGGLALLSMNEIDLHICMFSPHHIDVVVNPRIDDAWCFTGFYESPEVANREDSWTLLRHLSSQLVLPWVCIGDFNEITQVGEKSGGPTRPEIR